MSRQTFLSHWVICLVCAGAFAFAWHYGVPQLIFANDQSYMTSVIAALFVATAVWLGWVSWFEIEDSTFGHLAEELATRIGLIGTGAGIMLTVRAALSSANPLSALQTAFFSMICGVAAASLIAVMNHNIAAGLKRAKR